MESPQIRIPPSLAPDEDDATEPPSNPSTHDSSRPRAPSRSASGSSQRDPATLQQPATERRLLKPTFSVNIVRTPEHYKSPRWGFSRRAPHDYHTSPPTSGSSRHSNPLPAPPAEYSDHSISLSTTQSSKRKRKGFWNKRGDHFTRSGYVVYAPYDEAYPRDLQDYPDEFQGFVDENGERLGPGLRPELPGSASRLGRPPMRPYHSVS